MSGINSGMFTVQMGKQRSKRGTSRKSPSRGGKRARAVLTTHLPSEEADRTETPLLQRVEAMLGVEDARLSHPTLCGEGPL